MIRLSENVAVLECSYETDRPNLGYIKGSRCALMYDAGASKRHAGAFLGALRALAVPKPAFAAISHWHWDHSFGNQYLRENGIMTIASRETNEQLRRISAWKWDEPSMAERLKNGDEIEFVDAMIKLEYPDLHEITVTETDITFSREMTLDLGGVQCRLIQVGGPHSDDSIICYVPEEKIVFAGDSNGADLYGNPWEYRAETLEDDIDAIAYDPVKLRNYIDKMETLDFDICIAGHDEPVTRKEFFDFLKQRM
jgi:glyoxylase-like metal-dependent hydrolase (beta-lactamase superfamily II)